MMLTPNERGSGPGTSGRLIRGLARFTGPVWGSLPLILFVLAIALASFGYGGLVGKYRLFPYSIVADGVKTGRHLLVGTAETADHRNFVEFTDIPLDDVSRSRIEFVVGDGLQDPMLWYGGRFQFLELCPDSGCLAVEYTATGEVAHAWPFRAMAATIHTNWRRLLLQTRSTPMSWPSTTHSPRTSMRSACRDTRTATCWRYSK